MRTPRTPFRSDAKSNREPQLTAMLQGRDHLAADRYSMGTLGRDDRTVFSISLGGLAAIPRKGGTQVPNEDCLFAADFGRTAFHAVADGHRGHRASHRLIEKVADLVKDAASSAAPLDNLDWIYRRGATDRTDDDGSRTTAAVCLIDREQSIAHGWSVGDSAVFHLSVSNGIRRLNKPNAVYISPYQAGEPKTDDLTQFEVNVESGDVILSCTDGVFECHYGRPKTSLLASDIEFLWSACNGDLDAYVASVSRHALVGIRGNPGGEDNIALIATEI